MKLKMFETDSRLLRNWEIQNRVQYYSMKGCGNNKINLIPNRFVYGCYLYIRDILFLYSNSYTDLEIIITETFGKDASGFRFNLERYNSKSGPTYFIDMMIKPVFNHSYTIFMPQLPNLPVNHELGFKIHYRPIYKNDWNTMDSDVKYIMEQRLLVVNSSFVKRHGI
jgi:hypothetical protein